MATLATLPLSLDVSVLGCFVKKDLLAVTESGAGSACELKEAAGVCRHGIVALAGG